jgi:hypothetical protein
MTGAFVRRTGRQTNGCSIVLQPGANLQTGEAKFKKLFGGLTTLEADLLVIASAIFAIDRCIERGEREDIVRGIDISIPVVNTGLLQPLRPLLEDILRTLSYDAWQLNFRQERGRPERNFDVHPTSGSTLLFSGGLDSLAAATFVLSSSNAFCKSSKMANALPFRSSVFRRPSLLTTNHG